MLEHNAYVCVLPRVHLQTVLMPHLCCISGPLSLALPTRRYDDPRPPVSLIYYLTAKCLT